jgi:hypothetical protein
MVGATVGRRRAARADVVGAGPGSTAVATVAGWLLLLTVVVVGSVGVPAAGASDGSSLAGWTAAVVPLPNGGMTYDASRDVLLVGVAPSVPAIGNHLVELDPHTGALGRTVAVGADPRAVAVADDGSRAYVGLAGSSAVKEIDLASFTVTRTIWLGDSLYWGPYYAEDIEVQPGHPDVIVVSTQYQGVSPRHGGVAVFDDGVRRPNMTPTHTGANRITWSADPNILYGYNNETTGYDFLTLTVDANGVSASFLGQRFTGFSLDIERAGDEIVATNGQVVRTSDLTLSGSYTTGGAVEVDLDHGKTYFLNGTTLSSHDTATKLALESRSVPSISPAALVDAGSALAARGSSSVLLLGPGVSAAGFALPPAPPTKVLAWGARSTPIALAEIVASPDGKTLYGVTRQTAGLHPGSVIRIDVASGQITGNLFVGADPHHLDVSADGSTLMVGHNAANLLTEVQTSNLSIRRTIALPAGQWASDIAARPETSRQFAVVLVNHCCSPALEGQILVRDGVILPGRGPGHTGATAITFASDPNRLYGHNGGTTDFGFYTLAVSSSTGLTPLSNTGDLLQSFGLELVSAEGLVYATNGGVVDPTVPARVGQVGAGGQPVPVPAVDRLLMVNGSTIHEFGLDSFGAISSQGFSGGSAVDATLAGSTLAIATGSNVVFVPVGEDERPPPTVTSLEPPQGPTAGGGLLKIRGTGLAYATSVQIDGASTPFSVVDDTTITATIPPHAGGAVPVTVTNPKGTSPVGPLYTYVAPKPVVTSVSPPGGPTAGGNTVTIKGTGLQHATSVTIGLTPVTSFTVVNDTEVRAVAPARPAGSVHVRVTTAGGTNATGSTTRYVYDAGVPEIDSLTPNSGLRTGGSTVDIRGEHFLAASRVEFGPGYPATFQVLSDTLIRATTPAHPVGTVNVTVTTANGTSPNNPFLSWFSYRDAPPAVVSITPAAGPVGGGNLVGIYGSGFTSASVVRFGSVTSPGFVVLDDRVIVAAVPPGAIGTVGVRVTSPNGSNDPALAGARYTYGNPPAVTGLSAAGGPTGGGQVLRITGQHLSGATTIEFGPGTVAPIFQVVNDTTIDVLTPAHAAGSVDIVVTTAIGTSPVSAPTTTYTYGGAPGAVLADLRVRR